jgi:isochorismate hydrolase
MSYAALTARPVAVGAQNGCVPATLPPDSLRTTRLPRSRRVLLLVDFINPLNFPGAENLAPAAVLAARATARLKQGLAAEGVPTIYANDNYGVWQSDFHSQVSACLGMDGAPAEMANLLYPQASDLTLLKPRHSAFFASPLEMLLSEMQAKELIICGLATDLCIQLTAMDAFLREFEIWVPSDCTAAESAEAKDASLAYMASALRCDTAAATPRARAGKPNPKTKREAHA